LLWGWNFENMPGHRTKRNKGRASVYNVLLEFGTLSTHKSARRAISPNSPETVMKSARRLIQYLASAVGLWLLVSFAGAMVDSANAALWSNSLMWALLSCLVLAPALLMVNDIFKRSRSHREQEPASSSADAEAQKPFVETESDEMRTLWPEPGTKQNTTDEWPPQEAYEEHQRIGA